MADETEHKIILIDEKAEVLRESDVQRTVESESEKNTDEETQTIMAVADILDGVRCDPRFSVGLRPENVVFRQYDSYQNSTVL
jgi:hypothetical protein